MLTAKGSATALTTASASAPNQLTVKSLGTKNSMTSVTFPA